MRVQTEITNENDIQLLNELPLDYLRTQCVVQPMKVVIHNGCITGATISQRDDVSIYDGRNNYIEQERRISNVR